MRALTSSVLILPFVLSFGGPARAQDASLRAAPATEPRQRVFAGVAPLRTQTDALMGDGGTGALAEVGYDFALTRSSRVGLLVEAAVDFGSYGADADAVTWGAVGARYTHLFRLAAAPRLSPFLGAGVSVGRTGGELSQTGTFTALMLDAGVELTVFRHLALDLRLTDRPARMSLPGSSWHNAVGLAFDVAVPF